MEVVELREVIVAGLSPEAISRSIETGQLHVAEPARKPTYICFNSLLSYMSRREMQ